MPRIATAVNRYFATRKSGLHKAWNAALSDQKRSTAIVIAEMWDSANMLRRGGFTSAFSQVILSNQTKFFCKVRPLQLSKKNRSFPQCLVKRLSET